ncbi:hypothetical protein ASPZODRAFT_57811 [Penicilliopsis zonata CBS 506.65]|uniref:Pheromone-regulated membrane protein n=1 Tax=Penicilliopsis zonata CBS 506.65 TaxID=1073090 RepID=A0A1L9SSL9_9EURO|nr:hypothetical protein ASPZODRAFT_57811 [Penicilliopsis zonata CBS 506.65]OJJ50200.1 hypothetical protein ASPZODRAFT_57811 [Penicilliopsis zonata CBS 506.65]
MGCCGDREKGPVSVEERWEYINLDDFKSNSCLAPFSYFFLYVFLLVSIAVYAVDSFTAVNLLVFSRWAGQIKPAIPFRISRWIFAICIIISFVLLFIRWMRAIRSIRSGSIAQSYLDPLAVRVQCIRPGKRGRGWRRFLVFAELTKSKQGAEYVALFAYFSFNSWLNVIFADGPRQVVNAITLYSVMKLDLLPGGADATSKSSSSILQFFDNIKILAEENDEQALVLFGMLFTLIIWVFSVLKLALAIILYLIFLFHHIPSEDGSIKAYCRRKINTRLKRIVRQKVDKALNKGVALQTRKTKDPIPDAMDRKPTLPNFGDSDMNKMPNVSLSRTTTQTTLPPYSRPGTAAPDQRSLHKQATLPDISLADEKPPLSRTITQSSAYSESASLTGHAATMGYSPLDRQQTSTAPPVPSLPSNSHPPPVRSHTPLARPPTTAPRATPAPQAMGDPMPPHPAYRGSNDEYDEYESYHAHQPSLDSQAPSEYSSYRPYTPANDPYSRSLTHTMDTPAANGDYPVRSYTPLSSGTPQPPSIIAGMANGYPVRSHSPLSQSGTPRPPTRLDSPVNQRGTPRPPMRTNSPSQGGMANPPMRVGSPANQNGMPRPPMPSATRLYNAPRVASPSNESSHGAPQFRAYNPEGTSPY